MVPSWPIFKALSALRGLAIPCGTGSCADSGFQLQDASGNGCCKVYMAAVTTSTQTDRKL